MKAQVASQRRRGARRKDGVPAPVLTRLAAGEVETVNLMEWLAADMSALARTIATESRSAAIREALGQAAFQMDGLSILARLKVAGAALAAVATSFDNQGFKVLCEHRSDLVRQWACYAINDDGVACSMAERLRRTLPFAADPNMTVREAAWMAFRPHVQRGLRPALKLLERTSTRRDPNLRRFAVEVSRPYGALILRNSSAILKSQPRSLRMSNRIQIGTSNSPWATG
jgi:hypothetical protein